MTKKDKISLLHFVTRTGMFITSVDQDTITSFVHGYQLGSRKSDFIQQIEQHLLTKHKIHPDNLGWPGQVRRLSEKLFLSWAVTFKKITLEIIADEQFGGLDKTMRGVLKIKIVTLIERIAPNGDPWFTERNWVDEWKALCPTRSPWFKTLWTDDEWPIVKAIDRQVRTYQIFDPEKKSRPPHPALLNLRQKYDSTTGSTTLTSTPGHSKT